MNVTVRIPDELASRIADDRDSLARRALEGLVMEAFRAGRISKVQALERLDSPAARVRAFRAGKTLGGLDPMALIREGRR